jgi:hypothetical protein
VHYLFGIEYEGGRGIIIIVIEDGEGDILIVFVRFGGLLGRLVMFACAK